jgi:hypothetical protein
MFKWAWGTISDRVKEYKSMHINFPLVGDIDIVYFILKLFCYQYCREVALERVSIAFVFM